MIGRPGRLAATVSLKDVVTIGVGSSIGISIFSVLGPVAGIAGTGGLAALLLAAVPMSIFAVVYAFMTSAVPISGASFEWPSRFVSPFVGFIIAWLRILGSTGAVVQHGVILMQYLGSGLGWQPPALPTMAALFTVFYLVNLVGLTVAARAQLVLTAVLVVTLLVLAFASGGQMHVENLVQGSRAGWSQIIAAVPLMVGLFIGVEFAAEIGEEVRDAKRVIALGLACSVVVVVVVYASVTAAAFGVLGSTRLAESSAPLLDLARSVLGSAGAPIVFAAALAAITASLNGVMLIFSRFLFAMGRSGTLPTVLASIHPRFGTPHVALTVVLGLSLLGLLLPNSLVFLFLAVNIPTMFKYGANCLSAIRLVRRHPQLYASAGFAPPKGLVIAFSLAGIACAAAIIAAGLKADLRPYLLLVAWGAVGAIWWGINQRGRSRAGKTEE